MVPNRQGHKKHSMPCHKPIKKRVASIDYFLQQYPKAHTYGCRLATILALVDNTKVAKLMKYRNIENCMPKLEHMDQTLNKFFTRNNLLYCNIILFCCLKLISFI